MRISIPNQNYQIWDENGQQLRYEDQDGKVSLSTSKVVTVTQRWSKADQLDLEDKLYALPGVVKVTLNGQDVKAMRELDEWLATI